MALWVTVRVGAIAAGGCLGNRQHGDLRRLFLRDQPAPWDYPGRAAVFRPELVDLLSRAFRWSAQGRSESGGGIGARVPDWHRMGVGALVVLAPFACSSGWAAAI